MTTPASGNTVSTMRAAVQHGYGSPSVVTVTDHPKPVPAADQILVRVSATTVNRTDCGYRGARPFLIRAVAGLRRPRQPVLGTEFAGEVVEIGTDVDRFAVGDRVFGYNEGPFGTHAQFLAIGQDQSVAATPDNVDDDQAAAATEGAHYAIGTLRAAKVGEGTDVMVYGATGAIGSAAVQLAKVRGATVTAVCGTDHVDLVRGLGADRVVDYQTSDFTTDPGRYDLVLDAVGKVTFGRCRGLLKSGGIFSSSELGPWIQNAFLPLTTRFIGDHRVIFVFPRHDQRLIERFAEHLASGAFVPLIDRRYPLEDIVEAYEYVETGQKLGNVIINP